MGRPSENIIHTAHLGLIACCPGSQDARQRRAACSSAHLVFHGAQTERPLQPASLPRASADGDAAAAAKYVLVLSKPCDGVSATLWNVTGNLVAAGGRGHVEGFFNALTARRAVPPPCPLVLAAQPGPAVLNVFGPEILRSCGSSTGAP